MCLHVSDNGTVPRKRLPIWTFSIICLQKTHVYRANITCYAELINENMVPLMNIVPLYLKTKTEQPPPPRKPLCYVYANNE